MLPSYFQPTMTFTGHYEEFPTKAVQQWNDFVPDTTDLTDDYLRTMLAVRDENFPRGADTLVGASTEMQERYTALFHRLNFGFSIACAIGEYDLVPNGREMTVNEVNFLDYVRRVSELYRDFDERQVAFCTLEDDPVGLGPLVPTRVPAENAYTGKFDQVRTVKPDDFSVPGTGWLQPGLLDFSKALPFTVYPTCPSSPTDTSYTAVFLFCRMGDCIAGKCVGWAHQGDALAFRCQIAPGGWVPVRSYITAYRELSRHSREPSVGPSSSTGTSSVFRGRNGSTPVLGAAHVHTMRELREGQLPTPTPPRTAAPPHGANPAFARAPPVARFSSTQDRTAAREVEERRLSEYMREHAVARETTDHDRAMFSPKHEVGGLFAPIQPLNL